MSSENTQRQIEFIIEHQAKFSEDLELLKEDLELLKEDLKLLKEVQSQQTDNLDKLSEATASSQIQLDSVISEMRDGFDKLILSNEITRDFANKIASLEVQTSQRVTKLDQRVSDIESTQ